MSCDNKTHKLVVSTLGSQVDRYWIDLKDGQRETDPAVITALEALLDEEDCASGQVDCVESQEWTYGLDNTGTRYNDVATYEMTLSDGTVLPFSQDGSSNSWSEQLTELASNIQTAADNAGLVWFSEPRFVDTYNPSNIDGTIDGPNGTPSGLPGAPSEIIAIALDAGGMAWRYVNIQICPGQPVPVSARRLTSEIYGDGEYSLTTAGPVLGPVNKFFVCRECGDEPVWYLDDSVTEAEAGQIPNCYEPCGVLSQLPPPPNRECEFQISIACDNNNSTNTVDFTNTITRRAEICNGQQIAVDYFEQDPDDDAALIPYELVGDFVDCATGEPVPLPDPLLDCVTPANLVCKKKRTFSIFYDNGITPSSSSNTCGERANLVRFNQGFTSIGWETGAGLVGVGEDIGPYTGWGDQLTNWFGFGESNDPYSSTHAFNFQPAPTWRSWTIDGCNPDAQYGVWNLQRDDGCEYKVYPLKKSADIIEKIWCLDTVDCQGVPTTKYYQQNEDGSTYTEVEAPENPECYVPCDYVFPSVIMEGSVSPCETKEYTLCDNFNGVQTQFVQLVTTCGSQKIIERYTLQSYNTATSPDDLVEYNVQGDIVVCGTNDPFVEPEPECDDWNTVKLYSMSGVNQGVRRRQWVTGDPTLPTGDKGLAEAYIDSFDFDSAPDSDVVDNVGTFVLNDNNNSSGVLDYERVDGYIVLTEPKEIRFLTNSEGYLGFWIGLCCGEQERVISFGKNVGLVPTDSYTIPAGVHSFRIDNLDSGGTNSNWNPQILNADGLTWQTRTIDLDPFTSVSKPSEFGVLVKECKPSGAIFDFFTDEILDRSDFYSCPITCVSQDYNSGNNQVGFQQSNTHLLEGCILSDPNDSDGERLDAYTIVDDSGNPLFPPRPLTDAGFVECCPDD